MRISDWSSDVCSSDLIDRVLRLLDCKVRVYGTRRRGEDDNLDFRAPSVQGFIDDVAGCRAVLSTAGNQLIGEALHFGKPVLALPEPALEQRLKASMPERMGVGQRGDLLRQIGRATGGDRVCPYVSILV